MGSKSSVLDTKMNAADLWATLEIAREPRSTRGSGRTWIVSKCSLSAVWGYWLKWHHDDNESAPAACNNDSNETAKRAQHVSNRINLKHNLGRLCVKVILSQILTRIAHHWLCSEAIGRTRGECSSDNKHSCRSVLNCAFHPLFPVGTVTRLRFCASLLVLKWAKNQLYKKN